MNKLTKVGLTALAGSLVAGTVNAAEMSVSGSAGISFTGLDSSEVSGNGFTMGDSLTFSASGDVNDIGVTLSYELDGQTSTVDTFDDHSITLDFGDAGTLIFAGHGGSSAMSARDDVMPTAYEEPWDIVTGADTGIINGVSGENMFNYKYSHESGFMLQTAYLPSSSTLAESYQDFAVEYTGVDGLRIGIAMGESEATAGTEIEEDTIFATYAMGGITVGIQMSEFDTSAATGDTESTGFGISYQVTDDLSVSYNKHEYNDGAWTSDEEYTGVSASYTMGGITIAGHMNEVSNRGGDSTAADVEGYEIYLGFAF